MIYLAEVTFLDKGKRIPKKRKRSYLFKAKDFNEGCSVVAKRAKKIWPVWKFEIREIVDVTIIGVLK